MSRREEDGLFDQIVVGYDGSEEGEDALAFARLLADGTGDTLVLARVFPFELEIESQRMAGEMRAAAEGEPLVAGVGFDGSPESHQALEDRSDVRGSDPDHRPAVRREASKGVDVLFVGSRGYGPLRRAMLGSVSSELMATAPSPVVVTPRASLRAAAPVAEN